jgi:hypothetical protein
VQLDHFVQRLNKEARNGCGLLPCHSDCLRPKLALQLWGQDQQFLALVLNELHLRHVPVDRRDFKNFMRGMKALWVEGDTPQWWADTFQEAMRNEPVN